MQQDDEIRIKIVGLRVDATDIVRPTFNSNLLPNYNIIHLNITFLFFSYHNLYFISHFLQCKE